MAHTGISWSNVKQLNLKPREAAVLEALCTYGNTALAAQSLGIKIKTLETYIYRMMKENGYPNRLTLALAWDREQRPKEKK